MSLHDPFAPFAVHTGARTFPDVEKVRVAAILHKYPPWHNAGAEWMAHALFRDLVRRGHEVTVWTQVALRQPTSVHGVTVERWRHGNRLAAWKPHVMVTHLDLTRWAVSAAAQLGIPCVHLLHNDRQLQFHGVRARSAQLCVANSEWIRAAYPAWEEPLEVVHPPVEPDLYRVERFTDRRVTLMNLSVAKGGPLFWQLAERMPDRPFLAVAGAYAAQCSPVHRPANVAVSINTPRVVHDVYARTRVLLMPSSYESWGRCAIEAGCSGIPTVAHPTPGLVESMGSSAVWVDRDDVDGWVAAVERLLDDEDWWEDRSAACRARAESWDPAVPGGAFDRFEELIVATVRGTLQTVLSPRRRDRVT